jgi:hypothetical protein
MVRPIGCEASDYVGQLQPFLCEHSLVWIFLLVNLTDFDPQAVTISEQRDQLWIIH